MKIRFCIFLLILSVFPAFSQDRLTPVDHSVGSEILSKYYEKIDRLLMETDEYSYAFQIRPSFTPESCLLYSPDKKELVFRIASRNIWYSKGRIGVKKYHCPITSVISDKLDSLFSSAVISAFGQTGEKISPSVGLPMMTAAIAIVSSVSWKSCVIL